MRFSTLVGYATVCLGLGTALRAPTAGAADCNDNLRDDLQDIALEYSQDCNSNLVPDECEAALPGLAPAISFSVGELPAAVATGDLNADGHVDLVVANAGSGSVSVFLNQAGLTFHPPTEHPVTILSTGTVHRGAPMGIAIADIDDDGDPDIITVNSGPLGSETPEGTFMVFRNDGQGVFSVGRDFQIGTDPLDLAVGDLDRDGKPEVVATSFGDQGLSVLSRNESGQLALATPLDLPATSRSVAAADVDADSDVDLVVSLANLPFLALLRNRGDGTFAQPEVFNAGPDPGWVEVGDLNRDARVDLVVSTTLRSTITVLVGDGTGKFAEHDTMSFLQMFPGRVALADLDGDNRLDVVAVRASPGAIQVFPNDGAGHLEPPAIFQTGTTALGLGVGDFDGDGSVDVVTCGSATGPPPHKAHVLLNVSTFGHDWNKNDVLDVCDLVSGVLSDDDGDGFPDECWSQLRFGSTANVPLFHRGDVNDDAVLDLTDAVVVLGYLFLGADEIGCLEAADSDNDGTVALTDAIVTLNYLFVGGPPPAPPGPPDSPCGPDPDLPGSAGDLGCSAYAGCAP